jgi:hypothetical protein
MCAVGLALVLGLGATAANAQQTYKIGAICSLTGPAAGFGKPYCDGFEAYVKAWNARGGAKGRKVELSILDDETNAVAASRLPAAGGDARSDGVGRHQQQLGHGSRRRSEIRSRSSPGRRR